MQLSGSPALEFQQDSLNTQLHQLLGDEWKAGCDFRHEQQSRGVCLHAIFMLKNTCNTGWGDCVCVCACVCVCVCVSAFVQGGRDAHPAGWRDVHSPRRLFRTCRPLTTAPQVHFVCQWVWGVHFGGVEYEAGPQSPTLIKSSAVTKPCCILNPRFCTALVRTSSSGWAAHTTQEGLYTPTFIWMQLDAAGCSKGALSHPPSLSAIAFNVKLVPFCSPVDCGSGDHILILQQVNKLKRDRIAR